MILMLSDSRCIQPQGLKSLGQGEERSFGLGDLQGTARRKEPMVAGR